MKQIILVLWFIVPPFAFGGEQCVPQGEFIDMAWGMGSKQFLRFKKDMSHSRNQISLVKKAFRIEQRLVRYKNGDRPVRISNKTLADMIALTSECTGNDFTYFAAVLEQESSYCADRYNEGGGDSGCGQFTSAAIHVFKNQLRLKQRKSNGSWRAKLALEEMITGCYSKFREFGWPAAIAKLNRFKTLFGKNPNVVRRLLRSSRGEYLLEELISSAVLLKFHAAREGGYIVEGKRPGGVARYNGGGHAGYVRGVKKNAQKVSLKCLPQEELLSGVSVAAIACELQEDKEACMNDLSEVVMSKVGYIGI